MKKSYINRVRTIPTSLLLNREVSLEARGLFAFLNAKPEEYKATYNFLAFDAGITESEAMQLCEELKITEYMEMNEEEKDETGVVEYSFVLLNKSLKKATVIEREQIRKIVAYWNAKGVVVHKIINPSLLYQIEQKLQIYTYEDICKAIDNYTETYQSKVTWWRHKWTLEEFLKRAGGLQVFLYKTWQDYLDIEAVKKNPSIAVRKEPERDIKAETKLEEEKKAALAEKAELLKVWGGLTPEKQEELKKRASEQVAERLGDRLTTVRETIPKLLIDYEKQALMKEVKAFTISITNSKGELSYSKY